MNYKRITVNTLAKIAIGFLAVIAITVFSGTFGSSSFETVSDLKDEISYLNSQLAEKQASLKEAQAELDKAKAELDSLQKTADEAKKDYNNANAVLDTVCDRSYYSTFFCVDGAACQPLHNAVTEAYNKYSSANKALSSCEYTIENADEDIAEYTADITALEADIKTVKAEKAKATASAFFMVVAMIATLAGLVFISMYLLDRDNKLKGLIACATMAGSSILYMLADTKTTFATYLAGVVIFALYAGLISEKITKRVTARVFVIIISLILFTTTLFTAPVTALCAAIAFILISLVLVPCVFTEYLDIAKHIFFTIITFGIWHLIWMYNFTENLNKVEEAEKRAPVRELVLCALLPLYYIFWMYKTAENTELYGKEKDKSFKIGILCLALAVINPLLASVIIQDKTNVIVGKPVVEKTPEQPYVAAAE